MIHVAIMGFGTVGTGVAEILRMNEKLIENQLGEQISLKYILDIRDFPESPYADLVIHDFDRIIEDPEIDVVAETIGGARIAYEYTKKALLAGKSVVTSNKELVATKGVELLQIAREHGAHYYFEASVGGGIPILRPLVQCLAGNQIDEICGILNGTTNYILTRMVRGGVSFDEALKEAQKLGYAEQDPTADVEGFDSCRKICILANLAFGHEIPPEYVPTEGISGVTLQDVELVEKAGWRVKLVGRALLGADGKVYAYVAPHMIQEHQALASVEDVSNAIMVRGNAVGEVMFYGPGAGMLPTASAVVTDMINAAQRGAKGLPLEWTACKPELVGDAKELKLRYYFRVQNSLEDVQNIFPQCEILNENNEIAFITEKMMMKDIEKGAKALKVCARLCILDSYLRV